MITTLNNKFGNSIKRGLASSSITDTLIIYDNDHATHSYNSSNKREVINIDYTNNYEV